MRPLPARPGAVLPGLVCLLLAGHAARGAAQEEGPPASAITWEVGTPKAGWCLYFLMEPKEAARDLARDHRLVLAREARDLPGPVARTIADEPQYAEWVPAELCTYIAEAIWVDGRRFDRGDGGHPIAMLYWGVSAASTEGGVQEGGKVSLRLLGTNSSGLGRAMDIRTVPIDRVQVEVRPVKESEEDEEFYLKLEGATISFIGHPRQDSTLVPAQRTRTGAYVGNNRSLWGVDLVFAPGQIAALAGALRIVGKRGLAKALDRSPIRLLGPMIFEGRGTVRFTR